MKLIDSAGIEVESKNVTIVGARAKGDRNLGAACLSGLYTVPNGNDFNRHTGLRAVHVCLSDYAFYGTTSSYDWPQYGSKRAENGTT